MGVTHRGTKREATKSVRTKNEKPKEKKENTFQKFINQFDVFHLFFAKNYDQQFSFKTWDYIILIILTILSICTHFFCFGYPQSVVFDEVYFGNFTNYYINGKYFFDIHPPLGKQLIYIGSQIMGYKGDLIFGHIGQEFPNNHVTKLRFCPSMIGSFITPIVYTTLRLLDISYGWAIASAILPAFDNAMLVESRFVLIDAYLWFFAALSLMFTAFTIRIPKHKYILSILAGLSAGATVSIKLTGCGAAVGVIIGMFFALPFIDFLKYGVLAGISGFAVFFGSFYAHFTMLTKPGMGCRFHDASFCAKLTKGELNKFRATFTLLGAMLRSNFAIQEGHAYSSKWYDWPLLTGKGNYMWVSGDCQLWCVGNPIVWWFAFAGVIVWLFQSLFGGHGGSFWLFLTYVISYLPFALIKRVMWNYHYIVPLVVSLEVAAVAMDRLMPKARISPTLVIAAALCSYIIYIPVTYGMPITYQHFKQIMFKAWTY